jgi:hypothetical protein
MKTVSFAILASTWSLRTSGWAPSSSCRRETRPFRAYRPTTVSPFNTRTRTMTSTSCLYAGTDPSGFPADVLLRMVDEISAKYSSDGSADQLEQMEQLERALSLLIEDEKMVKQPRPPTIPPPLASLGIGQNNVASNDEALAKAEQALQKLRQRLKEEEATLRQAEQALARSREEDETLRKAEEALQRSREEAEKRMDQLIQKTEQAVASARKTREEKQRAEQIAQEISTVAIQKPRGTISLDFLSGEKDALVNGDASTNYDGVPILYDWVQYIDGSISGKVKGSKSFKDGSNVSTSPIEGRALFGSVVMTASGNK